MLPLYYAVSWTSTGKRECMGIGENVKKGDTENVGMYVKVT